MNLFSSRTKCVIMSEKTEDDFPGGGPNPDRHNSFEQFRLAADDFDRQKSNNSGRIYLFNVI